MSCCFLSDNCSCQVVHPSSDQYNCIQTVPHVTAPLLGLHFMHQRFKPDLQVLAQARAPLSSSPRQPHCSIQRALLISGPQDLRRPTTYVAEIMQYPIQFSCQIAHVVVPSSLFKASLVLPVSQLHPLNYS